MESRRQTMGNGSFRFGLGEFECVCASDGAFNYPLESLFANAPVEHVEEAPAGTICQQRR